MKKSVKKLLIASVFTTFICGSTIFAVSATSGNYTVAFGDTMWKISAKHNISLDELIKANPQIKNPTIIFPGQRITVPTADKTSCNSNVNCANKSNCATKINCTNNTSCDNKSNCNSTSCTNNVTSTNTKPSDNTKSSNSTSSNSVKPSNNTSSNTAKPNSNTASNNVNSNNNDISSIESEVIRLVNVERQKAGLPALKANSELSRVARYKSQDMADNNYFSHTSPTYGSPFDMMQKFGIRFSAAGENIAYGQSTAQEVMNGWMNSPGHRANILSSSFTEIGVGAYKNSSGVYYWTQQFIKPMN